MVSTPKLVPAIGRKCPGKRGKIIRQKQTNLLTKLQTAQQDVLSALDSTLHAAKHFGRMAESLVQTKFM